MSRSNLYTNKLSGSGVVLVTGSGGREQALAWKIAQSKLCTKVLVAPGNAGSYFIDKVENIDVVADDFQALADIAIKYNVEYTLVGSEQPLVAGIVDYFGKQQLPIIGPTAYAAQLEGSKQFCKEFLAKYKIPTASYKAFDSLELAKQFVEDNEAPFVLKADGLAAGKGVEIAQTKEIAHRALAHMMRDKRLGDAGKKVLIESFLQGEEASFIVLLSNNKMVPMATSQDHKRIFDGDKGPNTGGMGAYSPAPIVTTATYKKVLQRIAFPTLEGLEKEEINYCGFLYIGLMIDENGDPSVIEFNCRFGDPEAQPLMMRMQSDLHQLLCQAVTGTMQSKTLEWKTDVALGVVMASEGYPLRYHRGYPIRGLQNVDEDCMIFHSGTKFSNQEVLTAGGRVLCVTLCGDSIRQVRDRVYRQVDKIKWNGCFYRKDIGSKALNNKK